MGKVIQFKSANGKALVNSMPTLTRRARFTNQYIWIHSLAWLKIAIVGSFRVLVSSIRAVLLTLLIWFRPLLFAVMRPLSGLLFIAFMVCLFTHPADQRVTWGFGVMTFVAFLTMHFYDNLVMWLSDGNVIYIFN